jgi:hypothetical protein
MADLARLQDKQTDLPFDVHNNFHSVVAIAFMAVDMGIQHEVYPRPFQIQRLPDVIRVPIPDLLEYLRHGYRQDVLTARRRFLFKGSCVANSRSAARTWAISCQYHEAACQAT